jgi:hypothetical protein
MSFSLTISGHGPKAATVKKVFEDAVRELKANMGEPTTGWVDPNVTGSYSVGDEEGNSASGKAEEVDNS